MIILINHKYKYIIINFAKSGCSVVRLLHLYLISNNENVDKDLHHTIHLKAANENIRKYKNYYKILVYRNPYERIASLFYQRVCGVASKNMTLKNKIIKQPYELSNKCNTFNAFLNKLFRNEFKKDIHYQPQKFPIKKSDINQIINIRNIQDIFKDYNSDLHKLSNEILIRHDINFANKLEKYDLDIDYDLTTYDFFKDENNLLKKYSVPKYDLLLTPETIKKINANYPDDFISYYLKPK